MKIESESQGVMETESITQEPRRLGRIRHEPERYGFLITDDQSIVLGFLCEYAHRVAE